MVEYRVIERDRRDLLGEGPLWSARENAVYWTDIPGQRLNCYALSTGIVASWPMEGQICWAIEREAGGLVVGVEQDVLVVDSTGSVLERLIRLPNEPTTNRLNDAKADGAGRIWAGTMPIGADRPSGSLYRLDTDLSVHCVDSGYTIANGPAISADDRFMYHTDTTLRTIFRYDILESGRLGARVPFIEFEYGWGNPDGMTLDTEGGLWVACWGSGSIMRFATNGKRDEVLTLPASQLTSCTFAGADHKTMIVTSASIGNNEPLAGCLFAIEPGYAGLPPMKFRG
jgi:sugar lactone lactonase YvrE